MRSTRETDARKLSHESLEELRIRAVGQVSNEGGSPEAVAKALGINRRTIYRWLEKFHYGGEEALRAKPVPGRPRRLDAKKLRQLSVIVRGKNPLQLGFEFALWTVSMVRELIRRKWDIRLSEVSVNRVLRTLGFTPQRPLHRAWQQDPVLAKQWQEEEYPKIQKLAKRKNALVFFADEAGIRSDHHSGTTWSPKGQTPVVKTTGSRFNVNMLSAVSPRGEMRFMVTEGSVNSGTFIEFLQRLLIGAEQPIFLILDGHPCHKSKTVRDFVTKTEGKLTLFFLPPYSPELNADELVWSFVKRRIGRQVVHSKDDLKKKALSALRHLQKSAEKIIGFFQDPFCRYAAAT